jgi:hypothetical protein
LGIVGVGGVGGAANLSNLAAGRDWEEKKMAWWNVESVRSKKLRVRDSRGVEVSLYVCEEEHDRGVRGEVFQKRGETEKERKREREKERGQKLVVREGRRDSRGGICGKGKRGEGVGLERGRDR